MNRIFLLFTNLLFFLGAYSQQHALIMQGQRIGTYNSKNECETARTKMDDFDKEKFVNTWNKTVSNTDPRAGVGYISTHNVPDANFSKSCRCISLAEYEQIQIGQKYSPFVYGELTKIFDNANLENLAAMVPEIEFLKSDFSAMREYKTPKQKNFNIKDENIKSRADELDFDDDPDKDTDNDFDINTSISNISSALDNLAQNIDEVPDKDLSALIEEIKRLKAILAILIEANQQQNKK